jgi:hypothetical protein
MMTCTHIECISVSICTGQGSASENRSGEKRNKYSRHSNFFSANLRAFEIIKRKWEEA